MNLMSEFRHALQDGLGKAEADSYEIAIWSKREMASIAYSREKKVAYLLLVGGRGAHGLSADEYLDEAKLLNHEFGWFSAPAQPVGPRTFWGGRTIGPVIAYKFRVFNEPTRREMA